MISHKYRTVFVHIPRTGGTSIENVIWSNDEKTENNLWMGFTTFHTNKYQTGGLQHLLAWQIRQEVGKNIFEEYFKFSLVRNPYSRCMSQYRYMKEREDLRDYIGMGRTSSFTEYLELIQQQEHVQWVTQTEFLYDQNFSLLVDYVGRLESWEESFRFVLKKIKYKRFNIRYSLGKYPHAMKTFSVKEHKSKCCYNKSNVGLVQKIYKDDFKYFGYSTDIGKCKGVFLDGTGKF